MSALVTQTVTPLEIVTGLGEGLVEKLKAAGVTTVESLADMTPEQLEAIEGIGPKTVEKISIAVNNYFASLDGGEVAPAEPDASGEEAAPEAAQLDSVIGEISEESIAEGSVEADALAAEAEFSEPTPAEDNPPAVAASAEAATEEEVPEDKQS
ncbi:MAG: helix-hairpin-helix domain-containing protein [Terriglobales bacterium]